MAGTGPEDLHALAQELLDACVASLDTIPTFAPALGGAPERSFISPGLPVWDCCEQMTVHVDSIFEADTSPIGLASGRRAVHGRVSQIAFIVSVTRCVPTVGVNPQDEIPLTEDLESAAEQIHADGWALWNHIFNMIRDGELFERCLLVNWESLRAFTPSGGCGGWELRISVQLDGYEE